MVRMLDDLSPRRGTGAARRRKNDTASGKSWTANGSTGTVRRRDPAATREKVLTAGVSEFCAKGFDGARIDQIARRARCNIRMIYHYFGSKERLYLAALERVFQQLRSREEELDLLHMDPVPGMSALVDFTFDHMLEHQEFIRLISNENMLRGRFLKKSRFVPRATLPLVRAITDLLRRGQASGVFRRRVDPVQLYISILSVAYVHVSNKYTLSITFQRDLGDARWLAQRRQHAREVILGYLRP
jgi:AcrR family transcriptional regulator